MRMTWRWTVLFVALAFAFMFGLSVFGMSAEPKIAVDISAAESRPVSVHPVPPGMQVPKTGPARPDSVIITWDGGRWHAFSNRTDPFGCEVRILQAERVAPNQALQEVCHGAVYDLAGRHVAGPVRTLFEYPVQETQAGWLEIDLSRPAPAGGPK